MTGGARVPVKDRTQSRPEIGSTSLRSGGELALIWDTISHYSPVLIAPLEINSLRPARAFFSAAARWLRYALPRSCGVCRLRRLLLDAVKRAEAVTHGE